MSASLIEFTLNHYVFLLLAILLILPMAALVLLHSRLKPGKVQPHFQAVQQIQSEAARSLRRFRRSRESIPMREDARRKLLQFQSKVRFSEAEARRNHETELIRLLNEAARYGITVTPDESMVGAA